MPEDVPTREKRKPDFTYLAVIGLAPLIPLTGLALRNHPRLRIPVTFGLGGVILVAAHHGAMVASVSTK